MKKVKGAYIFWVLVALALSLPLWLTPDSLGFHDLVFANIVQLLASLLFISLLLERALEVFMTAWRRPRAALKDLKIQTLQEKIAKMEELKGQEKTSKQNELINDVAELNKIKEERTTYKTETQRFALWISVILGFLISAVGIRTLNQIIDPLVLEQLSDSQTLAFRLVDVFLTGGIIAGGSEGIHKIAQVYTNFMELRAESLKPRTL